MVYYVDDMILEVVATLFSGSSNDILVCKDRRSPVGARYTLLVIRDKSLVKTFISITEGKGKSSFFLKSFARNDELIYCFQYQEERRFSAFARGQMTNPAKGGEICARLVMECASSTFPSPLLYLILTQDKVHITRDNRIYFTPDFDLSQLDPEKTEADCTIRCAEIILELLEGNGAKKSGSCELIRKKCRSNSYTSFPELYRDIRLTAMPGEKLSIKQRLKALWQRKKDSLFNFLLVLCTIAVIAAFIMLISQIIFGDIPLLRLFENCFDYIGTEQLK